MHQTVFVHRDLPNFRIPDEWTGMPSPAHTNLRLCLPQMASSNLPNEQCCSYNMPNRIYHGTIRIPKPKSINTTSQFDWDGSSEAPVLGSFRRIIMLDVVKSPCTISASCAAVKIKYWLVEMKYHGTVIILRAFFQ